MRWPFDMAINLDQDKYLGEEVDYYSWYSRHVITISMISGCDKTWLDVITYDDQCLHIIPTSAFIYMINSHPIVWLCFQSNVPCHTQQIDYTWCLKMILWYISAYKYGRYLIISVGFEPMFSVMEAEPSNPCAKNQDKCQIWQRMPWYYKLRVAQTHQA